MAKSGSLLENTKVDTTMELFILDSLQKGEHVVIPDFGHLELKTLGARRTVLFIPAGGGDSFLKVVPAAIEKEKKDINALYRAISLPLKEGKIVNLPKVGVFRPITRENGEVHVSFLPSSYLRNLLNNGGEEVVEVVKDEVKAEVVTKEPLELRKGPIIPPKTTEIKKLPIIDVDTDKTQNEIEVPQSRNISGILLVIVAVIFVAVIIGTIIHSRHNKKIEAQSSLVLPKANSESIDLTALALQHYGNSAFWIYIYQANMDKLKSPINIPQNVSLVIPDLKNEFDVDITDSMEIQRANILTDIVLNNNNTNK
ncbi:MAG: hypothetical protein FWD60_10055 [Candidatus Azobacteroides sp.]|nr:hypothetical protein [Candidatus Azobacteroides sp.]